MHAMMLFGQTSFSIIGLIMALLFVSFGILVAIVVVSLVIKLVVTLLKSEHGVAVGILSLIGAMVIVGMFFLSSVRTASRQTAIVHVNHQSALGGVVPEHTEFRPTAPDPPTQMAAPPIPAPPDGVAQVRVLPVGPPQPATPNSIVDPVIVESIVRGGPTWEQLDARDFKANIYPSLVATVEPLANEIANSLKDKISMDSTDRTNDEEDDSPNKNVDDPVLKIIVSIDASFDKHGLTDGMAACDLFAVEIQESFPDLDVELKTDAPGKLDKDTVLLKLSVEPDENDGSNQRFSGRHVCTIKQRKGSEITRMAHCRFVDKPWVESFERLVNKDPSKFLVVGHSGSFASSYQEARALAMRDARSKCRITVGGETHSLVSDRYIIDRFSQKLSRPYGDVWREAILFEIPAHAKPRVAHNIILQEQSRNNIFWSKVFGTILLILSTIVICYTINWITQGYYRTIVSVWVSGIGVLLSALLLFAA